MTWVMKNTGHLEVPLGEKNEHSDGFNDESYCFDRRFKECYYALIKPEGVKPIFSDICVSSVLMRPLHLLKGGGTSVKIMLLGSPIRMLKDGFRNLKYLV